MGVITSRPALPGDYASLYELHRLAFFEYVQQTWGLSEDAFEADFRDEFGSTERHVLLMDGAPVGSLVVEEHGDHLYLDYLAVHPQYQKRGIGTQVMEGLMAEARRRRLPLRLSVLNVNPARRLYERLGFEASGEDEFRIFMQFTPGAQPHAAD